jgi:acetylornithine deacetylase/succinyl-diaminopimelate desuccinylase-like protein
MLFDLKELLSGVNASRLAEDLWRLVNIPSPTGQERELAKVYANMLTQAGCEVIVERPEDDSPAVIGRLKGSLPGATLQLAGHLDHIPVSHAAPSRTDGTISGRGAADMKNGLAGIVEIVRALAAARSELPGEVLVTAWGLHEAPVGDSSTLRRLIEQGTLGDAAIVAESGGPIDMAVVAGAGQSIWNIHLRRAGTPCHELVRPIHADGLMDSIAAVIRAARDHDRELKLRPSGHHLLRPESVFVGQVHAGDFYNRAAGEAFLQGTYRWHPNRDFDSVRSELARVIGAVKRPQAIGLDIDWTYVGESYQVEESEALVQAYMAAHEHVTGTSARAGGTMTVTDAARLVGSGGIPTITCNFDNEFSHADHEYVRLERVEQACRVALATAWGYLTSMKKERA